MRRVLAGLIVAGLCLVGAGPAWATFPGRNGRIAYWTRTTIHTILPDGTDNTTLAGGGDPSWSEDGRRIAFARGVDGEGSNIFTMRADGSDVRRVTFTPESEGGAAFSPDGRHIAFTASLSPNAIVSVRTDGSDRRVLANSGWGPQYFPDGRHIAYNDISQNGAVTVWIMRANGSHKRRLTVGGLSDVSPDGKHILFQRTGGVFTIRPDGSRVRRLPACVPHGFLRYSPNGRRFVWAGNGGGRYAAYNISTSRLDCADTRQVTHYGGNGGGGAFAPSWQPLSAR
jgi:Tol biopolymer transport system component